MCAARGVAEELAFVIPPSTFDTMELALSVDGELVPLRPVCSELALRETQRLTNSFQPAAVLQVVSATSPTSE
jgi:hypothetical protein